MKAEHVTLCNPAKSFRRIGDHVAGHRVGRNPDELGALAWLTVDRLTRPVLGPEEESDSGLPLRIAVMHDVDTRKILASHLDPNFLGSLPDYRRDNIFVLFQVTRHKMKQTIRVSGVRAPSQQQLSTADQDEMDVNDAAVARVWTP